MFMQLIKTNVICPKTRLFETFFLKSLIRMTSFPLILLIIRIQNYSANKTVGELCRQTRSRFKTKSCVSDTAEQRVHNQPNPPQEPLKHVAPDFRKRVAPDFRETGDFMSW